MLNLQKTARIGNIPCFHREGWIKNCENGIYITIRYIYYMYITNISPHSCCFLPIPPDGNMEEIDYSVCVLSSED